jgi:hypothetical protein
MRDEILAKLLEIETLLEEATCDGEQLAEMNCFKDVIGALSTLTQTVEYYID